MRIADYDHILLSLLNLFSTLFKSIPYQNMYVLWYIFNSSAQAWRSQVITLNVNKIIVHAHHAWYFPGS